MIDRYTRPEMGRLWSEEARLGRWLEVELALVEVLAERGEVPAEALRHRRTPMIGRTHGIHAEVITFGLKCASWYAELARGRRGLAAARAGIAHGKLSGAVGTFANNEPAVEAAVLRRLGLRPEPIATQGVPRDRHARFFAELALPAGTCERIAVEIRHLQPTEAGGGLEPVAPGQQGAPAMPHK